MLRHLMALFILALAALPVSATAQDVRLPENDGTSEWGFTCTCERCSGSASVEVLAAFDQAHLCVCGSVVTAAMKAAAEAVVGGPACRCETHNRIA